MGEMDRLRKYEQDMAALNEKMKAEKKRLREKEKRDTQRRKLLAGAICLAHAEKDEAFRIQINRLLIQNVPESERSLWPELFPPASDSSPADNFPPAPVQLMTDEAAADKYAAFRSGI